MPPVFRVSWWVVLLYALFIVLIGVGIVLPRYLAREGPRRNPTGSQLSSFATSIQMYAHENGRPPTTEQGLRALIEKPTRPPIPPRWKRYLDIHSLPNDMWGRTFIYECPGPRGSPFRILSVGKDGRRGTEDDIEGILPPGGL